MIGAFTQGLGFKIDGISGIEAFEKSFVKGIVGGVASALGGDQFGHGFAAAGFSSLAGSTKFVRGLKSLESKVAVSAIVGGTASELSGGKFANGAVTAAMTSALVSLHDAAELGRDRPGAVKAFPARTGDVFDPDTGRASTFGLFPEYLDDPVNREIFSIAQGAQRGSLRQELGNLGGIDVEGELVFTDLIKGLSAKIGTEDLIRMNKSFNSRFPGGKALFSFHTHGSDFKAPGGYENFSPGDRSTYAQNAIFGRVTGFVSTPQGLLLMHDPSIGVTVQIGRVQPVTKPAGR